MKFKWFDGLFIILACGIIFFVLIPIISVLFNTSFDQLIVTIRDLEVARSIGLTFLAGMIATFFGLIAGVPLAYLLSRRKIVAKELVEAIIDLPIIIPHTAAGVALLLVFGRRGSIGSYFANLGFFFTDNLAGIVVAMLFVSLPFLVKMSREAFTLVDEELEKVARTDGASSFQAFWHVTLPLAWRGIFAGALMMWARGISEFGAVVILAYHPKIVPVLVYERFTGFGLSAAQPIAAILIIIVLIVFAILRVVFVSRRQD